MNYKERDIASIVAYLKGKEHVEVSNIEAESGAEKLRVYAIVFELMLAGRLRVDQNNPFGSPKVVTLLC